MSETNPQLVAELKDKPKDVIARDLAQMSGKTGIEAKMKLEQFMQQFWQTPEGKKLRQLFSAAAYATGMRNQVKEVMDSIKDQLRAAFVNTGYSKAVKCIWSPNDPDCWR